MEEKIKKNKFKESNCVCLKKKHLKTKSGTRFSLFEIKHTKIYPTSVIIKTVNSNYMTSFIKPKISNHNHLVHTFNFSLLTHRKKKHMFIFSYKVDKHMQRYKKNEDMYPFQNCSAGTT